MSADSTPEATEPKQDTRFKPGQSGNPAGRPKGSRNILSERALKDILEDWEEHGKAAIQKCREDKPEVYFKTVVSLIPKQVDLKVDPVQEMTDDQLRDTAKQLFTELRPLLEATGILEGLAGDEEAGEPGQAKGVQALH